MKGLIFTLALVLSSCCSLKHFPPSTVLDYGTVVVEYGSDYSKPCREVYSELFLMQDEFGFGLNFTEISDDMEYEALFYSNNIPVISIYVEGRLFYHGPYVNKENFIKLIRSANHMDR